MVEISEIVRVLAGGAAAAEALPGDVRRMQLPISRVSDGFMRRV
jgi:capsule polysaccharide export protein KpsC/LpsZ